MRVTLIFLSWLSQVDCNGASSRGSDATVAQRSLRWQRRVQMRGRHTSASWTALYYVVQGRSATSGNRKAIGIIETQRNRKGGPRHVSVHCEKVGRRHSSSVGGTSTGRYVNTFLRIYLPFTNCRSFQENTASSYFRKDVICSYNNIRNNNIK